MSTVVPIVLICLAAAVLLLALARLERSTFDEDHPHRKRVGR